MALDVLCVVSELVKREFIHIFIIFDLNGTLYSGKYLLSFLIKKVVVDEFEAFCTTSVSLWKTY